MSSTKFDNLIHAPNRLQICALLSTMAELEFQVVKEHLNVSDSVLSKHVKSLTEANYLQFTKRTEFGRQRTWLALTPLGKEAYLGHVAALKAIVGQ